MGLVGQERRVISPKDRKIAIFDLVWVLASTNKN